MPARAAFQDPESDSEIFFASIFGATLVLLLNELVCSVVFHAGNGTLGPSLLSRAVPVTSVRVLYTLFVLLPAFVVFAAIGLPFFLRTLRAGLKGRLTAKPRRGLGMLTVAGVVIAAELHLGYEGWFGVTLLSATGLVLGAPTVAAVGGAHGFRLIALAGLAVAGFAWYESRLLAGVALELDLAPAALVAAAFFAATGLLTVTAHVLRRTRQGRVRVALCWVAAAVWLATPLLRARLTDTPALADHLELAASVGAAVVLTGASLLRRPAREDRSGLTR